MKELLSVVPSYYMEGNSKICRENYFNLNV